LTHRLKHLPEHTSLAALAERRTDVAARHGQAITEVDDLSREQRKADADVEQVKARRERNSQRIDGGQVSDPRQLQAMQHEVTTLARRISDLEDEELEVMERLEEATARRDTLAQELAEIESAAADQTRSRDVGAAEIAEQQRSAALEREALAADLPEALLTLYERLRRQLGGVAVGALYQGRCTGCQLDVGAAYLARLATTPSDEVLRCEECDRILVRTGESGL
jgi:predicted  nucleic acid-binding Zn-ribbon protein